MTVKEEVKEIQFWSERSEKYAGLEWAKRGGYLHTFIETGGFEEGDRVLDVGTGTGIVGKAICPFAKEVIGADLCPKMLEQAAKGAPLNMKFVQADLHSLPFDDGSFDKVTARMVFHHVLEKTHEAMRECRRVLKKGGRMVFSEGVPPTRHVVDFYTEMFRLKEERIT